ncbi:alpha/beta hydrolase [Pseudoxanthomonas wuyuanensis]|uniref:Acetyl esterase/lipase n=2 Tax=Pseudoxanthomonas wuyuanensis TaxID=1073196 RepID=A0A286D9P1_9GAMM|nr:alpha/beta hydrolase [Pseudoxanthomonas wuyuanensis]SOD55360.1 Acetyl esterase/lipase [Pseudoxanthomonas wuyuanensis]
MHTSLLRFGLLFLLSCNAVPMAQAQGFREWLEEARQASRQPAATPPALPAGARALRDVAYGSDPRQRFDVYLPARTRNAPAPGAPVLLFVHGGGWENGNKDNPGVVEDKAAYWLPKGYILVSTNYRMRPDTAPLDQARDVARALAKVQQLAPQWDADPSRVVLIGHSAGAHLAALVGASSALWREAGAGKPRGVVSLDSGALDVPDLMRRPRIPKLYHRAFGGNPDDWIAASPHHQLTGEAVPMLIVCSTRRPDACPQGRALAGKAAKLGVRMEVLPQDLSHREINRELGEISSYTKAVDGFIRSLVR